MSFQPSGVWQLSSLPGMRRCSGDRFFWATDGNLSTPLHFRQGWTIQSHNRLSACCLGHLEMFVFPVLPLFFLKSYSQQEQVLFLGIKPRIGHKGSVLLGDLELGLSFNSYGCDFMV